MDYAKVTGIANSHGRASGFDGLIEFLLVCLLAFMPLALGVVHAWSEEVVIAVSGAVVICLVLKLLVDGESRFVTSWSYAPIAAFVGIVLLQLVPLPVEVVRAVSPNTAALKTELLGDIADGAAVNRWMTLSFYRQGTVHDLRLVLAAAGVFVVTLNVFRRPEQIMRLLWAIALIGGVVAVIALAQDLFGNGRIYWFISSRHRVGHSGPFVNHSNYGQFMNLSIGAALAVLVVEVHRAFAGRDAACIAGCLRSRSATRMWLLVGIMGTAVATVFISLTRGGVISMLVALGLTMLLLATQRSSRGCAWGVVIALFVAFGCILHVGFETIWERLGSLRDLQGVEAGRLQILKDIAVCWTKFPLLGTGLGTHSVVYPMFDRSTIPQPAAHAENEYAQVLEETGAAGLAALVILGVIILSTYVRNVRGAALSVRSASYGLGFGIVAVLVHSMSDFGQHLPANGVLSAVFCALLLALSGQDRRASALPGSGSTGKRTAATAAGLACAVAVYVWMLVGAEDARAAEAHWRKVKATAQSLASRNWRGRSDEYDYLIRQATAACNRQPGDVRYRHWLNFYRWRRLEQLAEPNAYGVTIPERLIPAVRGIVRDLHEARLICPTYGALSSMAGQIEKFVLCDDSGAASIRRGYRLSPCDPIACLAAGRLDLAEGRNDASVEKFQRAVRLDPKLFEPVVELYATGLSRPDLAISAAGDDVHRLCHVAGVLERLYYGDLAEQALDKAERLLEARCRRSEARAGEIALLGRIHARRGRREAAIECYRRALALDYGRIEWRLALAGLLAQAERMPEAAQEARICLRLRPGLKAAEDLVARLSTSAAGEPAPKN